MVNATFQSSLIMSCTAGSCQEARIQIPLTIRARFESHSLVQRSPDSRNLFLPVSCVAELLQSINGEPNESLLNEEELRRFLDAVASDHLLVHPQLLDLPLVTSLHLVKNACSRCALSTIAAIYQDSEADDSLSAGAVNSRTAHAAAIDEEMEENYSYWSPNYKVPRSRNSANDDIGELSRRIEEDEDYIAKLLSILRSRDQSLCERGKIIRGFKGEIVRRFICTHVINSLSQNPHRSF